MIYQIVKRTTQSLIGKIIAAFIVILLIINFIALLAYVHHMHVIRYASVQERMAKKAVEIVSLATVNPVRWQQYMVNAAQDPSVNVSIDKKSLYKQKFTDKYPRWSIYKKLLRSNNPTIEFSYRLGANKWLNVKVNSYFHFEVITLYVLLIAILTTLIILFYSWSIQRFKDPLRNITDASRKLGVDLQAKPIPVYGPSMVKEAINSMNKMQARITALLNERTLTLAALSHDLRTPITRLKLKAQFIEDVEQKSKILNDIDEIQQMVNDTLLLAKQSYQLQTKKPIDLVSLIESLCADMRDVGQKVSYTSELDRFVIKGDPFLLRRAFGNLIDNAIKYGQDAKVYLKQRNRHLVVVIEDSGPGLKTAELNKVFEPFYRAEQSRSKETGGTGLGLAIAQSIVVAHNGKISLANYSSGLRVSVQFPAA